MRSNYSQLFWTAALLVTVYNATATVEIAFKVSKDTFTTLGADRAACNAIQVALDKVLVRGYDGTLVKMTAEARTTQMNNLAKILTDNKKCTSNLTSLISRQIDLIKTKLANAAVTRRDVTHNFNSIRYFAAQLKKYDTKFSLSLDTFKVNGVASTTIQNQKNISCITEYVSKNIYSTPFKFELIDSKSRTRNYVNILQVSQRNEEWVIPTADMNFTDTQNYAGNSRVAEEIAKKFTIARCILSFKNKDTARLILEVARVNKP